MMAGFYILPALLWGAMHKFMSTQEGEYSGNERKMPIGSFFIAFGQLRKGHFSGLTPMTHCVINMINDAMRHGRNNKAVSDIFYQFDERL